MLGIFKLIKTIQDESTDANHTLGIVKPKRKGGNHLQGAETNGTSFAHLGKISAGCDAFEAECGTCLPTLPAVVLMLKENGSNKVGAG